MQDSLRCRLKRAAPLIGSFIKTPTPHAVELAGLVGFDFVVLDAEHAPFCSRDLDLGILAGRAARIDVLVRLASDGIGMVQQVLDMGAAGVLAPHVDTAASAAAIVAAARFSGGRRGYSNSPRYAGYGDRGMADALALADADAAVILQIEDAAGLAAVDEIAAVPGVDALFVGRADLAVAHGLTDASAPLIDELAARIAGAAKGAGLRVATFYPDAASLRGKKLDVDMLVLGSDQSALRAGWSATLGEVHARSGH